MRRERCAWDLERGKSGCRVPIALGIAVYIYGQNLERRHRCVTMIGKRGGALECLASHTFSNVYNCMHWLLFFLKLRRQSPPTWDAVINYFDFFYTFQIFENKKVHFLGVVPPSYFSYYLICHSVFSSYGRKISISFCSKNNKASTNICNNLWSKSKLLVVNGKKIRYIPYGLVRLILSTSFEIFINMK